MRHKSAGFTLIEVLVATVISVAMLTLVMASFWTLWQTYRNSEMMREMQHEATFALTRIADKVRAGGVDYGSYGVTGRCENYNYQLCAGGDTFFDYRPIDPFDPHSVKNLFMGNYGNQDPLFSSQKFVIKTLHFSIFPTTRPDPNVITEQFQPQVTIVLELINKKDIWGRDILAADAMSLSVQTTISSRDYNF